MPRFALTAAALAFGTAALAQTMPPFGSDADQAYATEIWQALEAQNLVGENTFVGYPYPGIEPHGLMLETFYTTATIDGHEGALVVKRNYGPEGVSEDEVIGDPAGHLGAITVMFQREQGYDAETRDWFYVKFLPDGSLDVNPGGVPLAGLVGKGAEAGCIACHQGAGDDYLFTTDAALRAMH